VRASGLAVGIAALGPLGCGGGLPLLHGAAVLDPGVVDVGVGVTSSLVAKRAALPKPEGNVASLVERASVVPGLAPYFGARVGLEAQSEAGVAYAGRAARADVRHALLFGPGTLSVGLGASFILPSRVGAPEGLEDLTGLGIDVPILYGLETRGRGFAVWFGPRAGVERLRGGVPESAFLVGGSPDRADPLTATHLWLGAVMGARVTLRRLHVAAELQGTWHRGSGSIGDRDAGVVQSVTVVPSAALGGAL